MRYVIMLFGALLLAPACLASAPPAFVQIDAPAGLPNVDRAAEPTIGIPWDTDEVFYQAFTSTYRLSFADDANGTWTDVTSPAAMSTNLDPMLHADSATGRVWAGGLFGPCSIMEWTDDGGSSWAPSGNMCGLYGVDHQTIGSGPWTSSPGASPLYDRAVYYCAHGEVLGSPLVSLAFSAASPTACATSMDGGVTWGDPVPWIGGCGSLHGHVRVSPVTGFAAVPDADCATGPGQSEMRAGFAYSDNNGLTWQSRTIPSSTAYTGFNNPSLAFGHDDGWLWYGQAAADGAFIAMSKDQGLTWESLGSVESPSEWLDVGQFHEPPIVRATFPDVMVGDDDRVAFSFLGLEDTDGDGEPGEFAAMNQCDQDPELRIWHYYVATSYNAGQNWTVTKATADPVQVGGIFQGQGNVCRNLLDFNDMDIDSQGRIHISFADGCTGGCAESHGEETGSGFRTARAALIRQTGGLGLFSQHDVDDGTATTPTGEPAEAKRTSAPGFLGVICAVLIAVARRQTRKV